jgi:N-acetylmuramoyl-L-alanine amidase
MIGLCAGHSRNTTGERLWEWQHCAQVQQRLSTILMDCGHQVVVPPLEYWQMDNDTALKNKVRLFNRRQVDLAIEIHVNSGGGKYSTVLYWDKDGKFSPGGRQLAQCISNQFASMKRIISSWKAAGPRSQSSMGRNLYFLNETHMPSVITEMGFKDAPEQREFFDSKTGPIVHAELIHLGIEEYIR